MQYFFLPDGSEHVIHVHATEPTEPGILLGRTEAELDRSATFAVLDALLKKHGMTPDGWTLQFHETPSHEPQPPAQPHP